MSEHKPETGWFADVDVDVTEPHVWQPCFNTAQGHIPCFQVWFETKVECEAWISEHVIGADWAPGEPSARSERPTPTEPTR